MRDTDRKSSPAPALSPHEEHVQLLNSLTASLKDDLKRGLGLLDSCVNQLAQAKWIMINVERTLESSFNENECPACSETGNPQGNRAVSPPARGSPGGIITAVAPSTSKKRDSKTKKASVLPMVSGHTVQRPKINIARVDARGKQKPKKAEKETPPKVRARGAGSTALALASASRSSGRPLEVSDDETPTQNGVDTPKKKKAGPLSKTRIRSSGAEDYQSDGTTVAVNLDDVGALLRGRSSFVGTELNKFLKLAGMPLVEEEQEKPAKINSRASSSAEKINDTKEELKKEEKISLKMPVQSAIKSAFLNFAKSKGFGKLPEKPSSSNADTEQSKPNKKKISTKDSDSEAESKTSKRSAAPKNKKGNTSGDSDADSYTPKPKRPRAVGKAAKKDSDDDSDYQVPKPKKPTGKGKKKASSDEDSDFEKPSSPKKRGTRVSSGTTNKRSPKVVSKATISSDSDSDSDSKSKKPAPRARKNSDSGSSLAKKDVSPDRKSTNKDDGNKGRRANESPTRSVGSKVNNKSDSEEEAPKPKPKPGPASSKAKRTGGRPGPLSAKLKAEQAEKEKKTEVMEVDSSTDNNKKNTIKKKPTKSDTATFTSSDEEDDPELVKIKKSIPLNLQDAVRSPSPDAARDIFSNLLSAHNPLSTKTQTPISKLKQKSTQIKPKIYELDRDIQGYLAEAGKELVPYMGTVEADSSVFSSGKYYIVGKGSDEKLVYFDASDELQELEVSMSDVEGMIGDEEDDD